MPPGVKVRSAPARLHKVQSAAARLHILRCAATRFNVQAHANVKADDVKVQR